MEQTFEDLLRERAGKRRNLAAYAAWAFVETAAGIVRENAAMIVTRKSLVPLVLSTSVLLAMPLIGNLTSDQWHWSVFDFAAWGGLVVGTGLAYRLLASRSAAFTYRAAAGTALVTAFLLAWVNGAVGIIGNGSANLLYFGVLSVGVIGAGIARLRPRGMSRALFATVFATALVPVIALLARTPDFSPGILPVFALNTVFVVLFAASALLFRKAGRVQPN